MVVRCCLNSSTEVLTINPYSGDAGKYYITAVYTACDHSEGTEVRDKKAATCTQFGYTGDTVCTECGEVLTAGKDIKPTGHGQLYAADKNVYRTDRSGKVVYKDGRPVYSVRVKSTGTCVEPGYSGDMLCKTCGEVAEKGRLVKGAHVYSEEEYEYHSDHYCSHSDWSESWVEYECTLCGDIKRVYEGYKHMYNKQSTVDAVAATCLTPGYSGDVYCSYCDSIVEYGHVIPAKGHRWMSPVTTLAPTATTEGKASVVCASCGMSKVVTLPRSLTSASFDMQLPTTPDGYKTPPVITGVDSDKISVFS